MNVEKVLQPLVVEFVPTDEGLDMPWVCNVDALVEVAVDLVDVLLSIRVAEDRGGRGRVLCLHEEPSKEDLLGLCQRHEA